jgi:uncharacterized protein YjbI with pentapeptide repeats
MLTKNLSPFLFGAKVCSRRPPRPEMTLIVKGLFELRPDAPLAPLEDQGALTAEVFQESDVERRGECLYGGDFADFKPNAEVLLRGTCHAPPGRSVTEATVRLAVGAWSKELRVVGPRTWTDSLPGAKLSEPLPFATMVLSYENAFGGPGYAPNPAGKGWKTPEAPTVELPADPLRSRSQTPDPASFGPLNPAWPPRAAKVGTGYGKSYAKERAPFYAADFDWSYFNAAPADQQLEGYLRGDEEVTLRGFHPSARSFSKRLPGLRVRAFLKDVEKAFREVPMRLDTLFVDADAGTLALTFRGVTPVREQDLADVATVLVASEALGSEPLPASHYEALLDAFARDPVGIQAAMTPALEELAKQSGVEQAFEERAEGEELGPSIERSMRRAFDDVRTAQVARLTAAAQNEAVPRARIDDALARAEQDAADTPPVPVVRKPGAMPILGLSAKMREVESELDAVKARLEGKPVSAKQRADIEATERLIADPKWAKLDPSYVPPGPVSTDAPGPGRDLSDQDLSHHDLRGMDLTGATLVRTILTGADLRGAKLAGANLKFAVLFKTDLAEADLTGADLTSANAASAHAPGATLAGANLEMTFFEGADLSGADLTSAKGEYTVFANADLRAAQLGKVSFFRADFTGARLDRASFAGACLSSCTFEKCRGEGLDFTRARLAGTRFPAASLPGARFVEVRAEGSTWVDAALDGADFSYATLTAAHFTGASLRDAKLFRARLRDARFYRACLERADLVEADLFAANLCKSLLAGARFTRANLYRAKLLDAGGAGTDFTGANLTRSLPELT